MQNKPVNTTRGRKGGTYAPQGTCTLLWCLKKKTDMFLNQSAAQ